MRTDITEAHFRLSTTLPSTIHRKPEPVNRRFVKSLAQRNVSKKRYTDLVMHIKKKKRRS